MCYVTHCTQTSQVDSCRYSTAPTDIIILPHSDNQLHWQVFYCNHGDMISLLAEFFIAKCDVMTRGRAGGRVVLSDDTPTSGVWSAIQFLQLCDAGLLHCWCVPSELRLCAHSDGLVYLRRARPTSRAQLLQKPRQPHRNQHADNGEVSVHVITFRIYLVPWLSSTKDQKILFCTQLHHNFIIHMLLMDNSFTLQ